MREDLTKEDLYFLARVKGIEVEHLIKMKGALDPKRVRGILIRYEFRERTKQRHMSKREVIALLMHRYNASRSYIETIVYDKARSPRGKECRNCGGWISLYMWSKYHGFCKKCRKSKTI